MPEVYVSTDVETDGPIPGPHSMCSFASVALLPDKTVLGSFSANLELLPSASGHPEHMDWWANHPEAWQACRTDLQRPEEAMQAYVEWVETLPGKPVFVAYPVGFDFGFIYWYLMRFVGRSPFRHHGIDIHSYAMAMLKRDYAGSSWANYPDHWFDDLPHTHQASDDALRQGMLFCNMLAENLGEASLQQ